MAINAPLSNEPRKIQQIYATMKLNYKMSDGRCFIGVIRCAKLEVNLKNRFLFPLLKILFDDFCSYLRHKSRLCLNKLLLLPIVWKEANWCYYVPHKILKKFQISILRWMQIALKRHTNMNEQCFKVVCEESYMYLWSKMCIKHSIFNFYNSTKEIEHL